MCASEPDADEQLSDTDACSSRKVYTVNWEMAFGDAAAMADDLSVHSVSQEHALASDVAVEIQYDAQDTVVGVIVWDDGVAVTDPANHIVKKWQSILGKSFPRPERVNMLQMFFPESYSSMPHRIGGKLPAGLTIPQTKNPAGLQHVATLTSKAGILPGWDHPLHVLCPLFVQYFPRLDLDYSDPMSPVFVDQDAFESRVNLFDLSYDKIKNLEQIKYGTRYFFATPKRARDNIARRDDIGGAGAPIWVQGPNPPRCPKSGKMMEFIAQLDSPDGVKAVGKPFAKLDEPYQSSFQMMNFAGSGRLYVFYAPDTKIVTTFIQNT